MVSRAEIRLRSRESARAFKGIICDDVSEFESYMPSQAVGLYDPCPAGKNYHGIAGNDLLIERDRGQIVPSRRRRMMASVRPRLLKTPAEPSPELRISAAAAQTRVVSLAGIRLGSWESARAFKGIVCDDISGSSFTCPAMQSGLCRPCQVCTAAIGRRPSRVDNADLQLMPPAVVEFAGTFLTFARGWLLARRRPRSVGCGARLGLLELREPHL